MTQIDSRKPLPDTRTLIECSRTAVAAAKAARNLREELRWAAPVGDPERNARITAAIAALNETTPPIRSALGILAGGWQPDPDDIEQVLRAASDHVKYERKQLKKMLR